MALTEISCSRWLWYRLIRDLYERGAGKSESGAFLLGQPGSKKICHYALFDDLEPGCLRGGYIHVTGKAYVGLAQVCERTGLKVIADVHTHPGTWVDQSDTDQEHPMMSRAGHVALIVPRFARGNRFSAFGVGIHFFRAPGYWVPYGANLRLTYL